MRHRACGGWRGPVGGEKGAEVVDRIFELATLEGMSLDGSNRSVEGGGGLLGVRTMGG